MSVSADPGSSSSEISAKSLTLAEAIANLKQTEEPDLRYYAAWWLGRFRVNQPEVIELLIEALSDQDNRSPDGGYPLRRNAARALGKLGDRRAIAPLLDCLCCDDYYVRGAATESLGELGDPTVIEPLLELLAGGVAAATMMPGKPHLFQPYDLILEALGSLGATVAIAQIEPFLGHFSEKVQYAAARSLYQLTLRPEYGEILVRALGASDLQLRRAALMDIGAVGYMPGAEAIAATLAENSLKLIALRGLLETHLKERWDERKFGQSFSPEQPFSLEQPFSPEAIRAMDLMDSLL
ncbi:MAG: HEAT repeat domain-containing protein [Synechococcales cyanobacterium CRU_2_2]|nr:HEAT repeat domain-containing protein [Synechococcales cyanobacterium CRU_2_2]